MSTERDFSLDRDRLGYPNAMYIDFQIVYCLVGFFCKKHQVRTSEYFMQCFSHGTTFWTNFWLLLWASSRYTHTKLNIYISSNYAHLLILPVRLPQLKWINYFWFLSLQFKKILLIICMYVTYILNTARWCIKNHSSFNIYLINSITLSLNLQEAILFIYLQPSATIYVRYCTQAGNLLLFFITFSWKYLPVYFPFIFSPYGRSLHDTTQ